MHEQVLHVLSTCIQTRIRKFMSMPMLLNWLNDLPCKGAPMLPI